MGAGGQPPSSSYSGSSHDSCLGRTSHQLLLGSYGCIKLGSLQTASLISAPLNKATKNRWGCLRTTTTRDHHHDDVNDGARRSHHRRREAGSEEEAQKKKRTTMKQQQQQKQMMPPPRTGDAAGTAMGGGISASSFCTFLYCSSRIPEIFINKFQNHNHI